MSNDGNYSYRADVATLLRGFEEGVFIRDASKDVEPGWAIKLLPYLAAMGRLAKAEYPSCGPGQPLTEMERKVLDWTMKRYEEWREKHPSGPIPPDMEGGIESHNGYAMIVACADLAKARSTPATNEKEVNP